MAAPEAPPRVKVVSVFRESLVAWYRDFVYITILAAIVETPVVLGQLAYIQVHGGLPGADEGVAVTWGAIPVVLSSMLAHYFLAAVIEVVEAVERHGHRRPTVIELIRTLPWNRLIVADVLVGTATIVGLFLFIVPGVIIATYTLIVLPLLNMERQKVVPTIRRSVQLVHGHVRTALTVWLIISVGTLLIEEIAGEIAERITHSQTSEFLAHLGTEVVLLPFGALPVVMLAFDLVAVHRGERDARSPH